jgi:hypothetical protein
MPQPKTLLLFNYDWDEIATRALADQWPAVSSGFDLFSFPSNARLAWFDMDRFVSLAALKARFHGATAVMSNHEQFGALCAALLAEKMGWPGTPVNAILACQHKLHARNVLQTVAPEANLPSQSLDVRYGDPIPLDLGYPAYVKPVKAAFSVLSRQVRSHAELTAHTRFAAWELWVIRHLVEPFERIARKRLPQAGTAHRMMLEQPFAGQQYCLDGYVFNGRLHTLGVVDAVMYPGTDCFMRFDYPSQLGNSTQARAADVAKRFLDAVGFTHGLFNMEFFYREDTDELKVIEFNPRMASQFSDLYERVRGLRLHEIAFALAHGQDPAQLPARSARYGCASSFVFRSFPPDSAVSFPTASQKAALGEQFPDSLLFDFPKDTEQIARDFKWLQSYRYGILHLGAANPAALRQACEQACATLGWPIPYHTGTPTCPIPVTSPALLSSL